VSSSRPPERWPPSAPDGRFGEPDPDDDDTGPLQVSTPSPSMTLGTTAVKPTPYPRGNCREMPACIPRVIAPGRAGSNH
jgi:hypothetical protein